MARQSVFEELERKRMESEVEEEPEPPGPITKCSLCAAYDEPPAHSCPSWFLRFLFLTSIRCGM